MKVVKWVMKKNGQQIAAFVQDYEEYLEMGGTTALEVLVPVAHLDACDNGEWDRNDFVYHVGDDVYTIEGYIIERE